jgi:antitoxin HicB
MTEGEMFEYPVELAPAAEGGWVVTFPDVPEAITQGEDRAESLLHARDALETALDFYIDDWRALPVPGASDGRETEAPDALVCAKLALYEVMREQGVNKAELGRRLGWHPPQVERVLALTHASRLERVEAALAGLGQRLVVGVRRAA